MDEFSLIRRYFQTAFDRSLDVTGGADDCAALQLPSDQIQHLSIDTMVENVHFYADMPSDEIGHRALATALSDLAAMGAKPWWCSLALTLPVFDEAWLSGFSDGFHALAKQHNVQLIGGDTTKGPLTITVQVAGLSSPADYLTRRGAQIGDLVCVTGCLGDAAGGLQQWHDTAPDQYLRTRYTKPTPRCEFGALLASKATAAIDISDGLLADVGHIAKGSRCGIQIDADRLPVSDALVEHFGPDIAQRHAISGGDDYELCFCVSPSTLASVKALASACDLPVSVIGQVTEGDGVSVVSAGQVLTVERVGYNHFKT